MTQKELGYVELEWTCKHCGTINPGMQKVCSNCGAPIGEDDKFELPDQQELITDKEKLEEAKSGPAIHCPYCSALNPADTKLCVQCGGDIQEGLARQAGEVLGAYQTAAVPDKPCPFCNQPVKANAQRCPNCGGSLVTRKDKPAASKPAAPKKPSIWLIVGGVILALACIGSLIAFIVASNKTEDVTASVVDKSWQLSIDIMEKRPVQKEAWEDALPSDAEDVSCREEYNETSNVPVPNATEECGTPYMVDTGSGAGKVVQDCVYLVYDSYCSYSVLDWTVVDTVVGRGSQNDPEWPATALLAGQQEGDRHESYQVTFATDEQTYTYTPDSIEDFSQYELGTQWLLAINTFNQIRSISSK